MQDVNTLHTDKDIVAALKKAWELMEFDQDEMIAWLKRVGQRYRMLHGRLPNQTNSDPDIRWLGIFNRGARYDDGIDH